MTPDPYLKALYDVTFAQDELQRQLKKASAFEGMLLLQILAQVATTKALIASMMEACQYEPGRDARTEGTQP